MQNKGKNSKGDSVAQFFSLILIVFPHFGKGIKAIFSSFYGFECDHLFAKIYVFC